MTSLLRGAILILLAACTGCGADTANVSGKVSFQGKPVAWGNVMILGSDGVPKSGTIQPDGTFSVSGVKVGAAKVSVSSPTPPGFAAAPAPKARFGRDAGDDDKVPPPPAETAPPEVLKAWFPIPEKYGDPAKSDLKFEIKAGQPLEIELK